MISVQHDKVQALYDLLAADECATVDHALQNAVYVTVPARGKRDLTDVATLIAACVRRIEIAKRECPTQDDYQAALKAEHEARREWLYMKSLKLPDTDGTWSMKVTLQKHVYEMAKEQRIEIGGLMIGTGSTVRRMYALIAGEMLSLQKQLF